jgi:hypothetical protein
MMLFGLSWFASAGAAAADAASPLDAAGLGEMVATLGYDAVAVGPGAYEVTAGEADRRCVLRVALGEDRSLVWLFALMATLGETDSVSKEALLRLLAASETFGPTYFSLGGDGDAPRVVYLNRALENDGIAREELGAAIEDFCADAHAAAAAVLPEPVQPQETTP